jgi:hypothetical protein
VQQTTVATVCIVEMDTSLIDQGSAFSNWKGGGGGQASRSATHLSVASWGETFDLFLCTASEICHKLSHRYKYHVRLAGGGAGAYVLVAGRWEGGTKQHTSFHAATCLLVQMPGMAMFLSVPSSVTLTSNTPSCTSRCPKWPSLRYSACAQSRISGSSELSNKARLLAHCLLVGCCGSK